MSFNNNNNQQNIDRYSEDHNNHNDTIYLREHYQINNTKIGKHNR